MIIRNRTTSETARGLRSITEGTSEASTPGTSTPRQVDNHAVVHSGRVPQPQEGDPSQGRCRRYPTPGGATHAPFMERRRHQRLGGTIADNHIILCCAIHISAMQ